MTGDDYVDMAVLAAEAIGLPVEQLGALPWVTSRSHPGGAEVWRPLSDSGQALRVACALSMDIQIHQITVTARCGQFRKTVSCTSSDRPAATRLAIVGLAAMVRQEQLR